MKKRVLLTGGNGFIGSGLVKRLNEKEYQVTIFDKSKKRHPLLKNLKYNYAEGDILDYSSVSNAMKNCDYVIHLAAMMSFKRKDNKRMHEINLLGTRNVLKAALKNKIKKLVHISSTSSIGYFKHKKVLNETNNLDFKKFSKTGYMTSKVKAEDEVKKFVKKGLNACIINPSTIIGAGDINVYTGVLIKKISQGALKFATPGGMSVVSKEDVIEGMIKALEKGKKGERYILASEALTFKQISDIICEELGKPCYKIVLPSWLGPLANLVGFLCEKINPNSELCLAATDFSFGYRWYDSSKARKELGWKPKQTIRQAIRNAIEFYQENNLL